MSDKAPINVKPRGGGVYSGEFDKFKEAKVKFPITPDNSVCQISAPRVTFSLKVK